MSVLIRKATELDLTFAVDLARHNMAQYYASAGRTWEDSIFRESWPETENFVLSVDGNRIGTLRLTQEGDVLFIRDVQIVKAARGKGHGTAALAEAERIAQSRGVRWLRLAAFRDNPAGRLYRRLGYRQINDDGPILQFEKRAA